MTPTLQAAGITYKRVLAYDIPDLTVQIVEYVPVNRASNKDKCMTCQDIAIEVADALCSPKTSNWQNYQLQKIETGEDNGLLVSKVVMSVMGVEYIPLIPTEGGQFTVNISGISIDAAYNESTKHWEWTGPDYRSNLELWYDDASNEWVCIYSPNPAIPSERTTSSQPIDAKELTFENGWTAEWGKLKPRGGTMTADFTDDSGNPIIATWSRTLWMAQPSGYTIRIEPYVDIWKLYITDNNGGSWTIISENAPTDHIITFEGDNPLKYKQTWTWSKS